MQRIEKITLPMTGGSGNMPTSVITETAANAFSGIIINIFPKLESVSVHKSLNTIETSSIVKNFTFDNLFLGANLYLSSKSSIFVPGLINVGSTYIHCWYFCRYK